MSGESEAGLSGRNSGGLDGSVAQPAVQTDDDQALSEIALRALAAGQLQTAMEAAERAVQIAPERASHQFNLGVVRAAAGMHSAAIPPLETAVRLDPSFEAAHVKLGQMLMRSGRRAEAIQCFESAVGLNPSSSEAHSFWAEALIEMGRADEAAEHLLAIQPKSGPEAAAHGSYLQALGQFDAAERAFERAIALSPLEGAGYYGIVRGRRMVASDRELIQRMEAVARSPKLRMGDRVSLQFGLGKAKEDLGEYGAAMRHYDEANGLAMIHRRPQFVLEDLVRYNDWRIRAYQPGAVARFQSFGNPSPKPVMVVGMIRSGTTLVEQMLSAHPLIGGCGELRYWYELQDAFNSRFADGTVQPEFVRQSGDGYVELLDSLAPEATRAVDKMPLNYFLIGPIHVCLPGARFVHVRRNALDTCLSIYTTFFEASPPFAHDQRNIVAYYREYERLMSHWRSILGKDRLFELDYEQLLERPESTMRGLLEFLGLPWDDACVHPEENRRVVRTPSLWQVRQPLNTKSMGRAERFGPWLGDLAELKP